MATPPNRGWTLYSPSVPSEIEAPIWGEAIGFALSDQSTDGFHEGGWFLPEACHHEWRFGVSQDRLCNGRVHAFLRAPSAEELSVVLDHPAVGVQRLNVPSEPGYLGAVLVGVAQSLSSREALVNSLLLCLPDLQALIRGTARTDA